MLTASILIIFQFSFVSTVFLYLFGPRSHLTWVLEICTRWDARKLFRFDHELEIEPSFGELSPGWGACEAQFTLDFGAVFWFSHVFTSKQLMIWVHSPESSRRMAKTE